MREFELCKQLSRKMCKDLGVTPFSITKASLTHQDLSVPSNLKIQEEDGSIKVIPMWYGEANGGEGITCCLMAGLDANPETLEIVCVIGFKDFFGEIQSSALRAGFRYDWTNDEDGGTLVFRAKERWLEFTLAQRLQFALGFEYMVQDGVLWNSQPKVPEEFRKNLSEIISLDEDSGV